jgi:hypothetical protein
MIGLVLRSFCGAPAHRRIKARVGDHEDSSSDVTGSIGTPSQIVSAQLVRELGLDAVHVQDLLCGLKTRQ